MELMFEELNHYKWLEVHFVEFAKLVGVSEAEEYSGCVLSHADKCYGFKDYWNNAGIPFRHGVAVYLLTYISPWRHTVRLVKNKWVDPCQRVIDNYPKFKNFFPPEE